MGISNADVIERLTATWTARAGRDPATLLVDGATPFRVRETDSSLSVTSHVTGSTYELPLPVDNEELDRWLDEIGANDVFLYEQRPD